MCYATSVKAVAEGASGMDYEYGGYIPIQQKNKHSIEAFFITFSFIFPKQFLCMVW